MKSLVLAPVSLSLRRGKALFAAVMMLLLMLIAASAAFAGDVTQGTLQVVDKDGKVVNLCPLKHTDVQADISGFITRVTVVQKFENPFKNPIEAVYVFPLPQNAAVDDMTMKIGQRTIKGVIKKKEEARKIYDDAKRQGKTAALLDQERPNIFTQSVANIMPGESIIIEISYVETLSYTDGVYEFVFPMVVGPRYIPGDQATGHSGTGWSPDTNKVPDASKITPPVAPKGTRAGHDITVSVNLNAGVPVKSIKSVLHQVNIDKTKNGERAKITLSDNNTIPNKDFILQYETAGKGIEEALLTTAKDGAGYFTFILQPPDKPAQSMITPKEMFFVIDSSGSQMGWPIEKAKETMKYCIENMNPGDTFQVLSFDNNVTPCFAKPVPNSKENREAAQQWLALQSGHGGTEMMKAIDYALGSPADPQRMRVVVFMTDGYVGNDMAITDAIKKKLGKARLFSFGTGNSVNRYLLENMAKMGKGEVEWVTLNRHGDEVAETFKDRINNPLLLDVSIDWGNAPVKDIYPVDLPDLYSSKPLVVKGRFTAPWKGEITLKGLSVNKPYSRKIAVNFPKENTSNKVLGVLWARTKIEDLMNKDLTGIQQGKPNEEIKEMITKLGLDFRLMTQYTSFVAVEEKVVNKDGKTETIAIPVEMPDGVSHEGVFGERDEESKTMPGKSYSYGGGKKIAPNQAQPSSTAAPAPMAKPAPMMKTRAKYDSDDYGYRQPVIAPEKKIDESLKNIADRVKSQGREGNLKLANVEVRHGKVHLILTVTHVSGKMLSKLNSAGFKIVNVSKMQKLVTGITSVDKIDNIAKLDFVVKIDPMPSFAKSVTMAEGNTSLLSLIKKALGMLN